MKKMKYFYLKFCSQVKFSFIRFYKECLYTQSSDSRDFLIRRLFLTTF